MKVRIRKPLEGGGHLKKGVITVETEQGNYYRIACEGCELALKLRQHPRDGKERSVPWGPVFPSWPVLDLDLFLTWTCFWPGPVFSIDFDLFSRWCTTVTRRWRPTSRPALWRAVNTRLSSSRILWPQLNQHQHLKQRRENRNMINTKDTGDTRNQRFAENTMWIFGDENLLAVRDIIP